MSGEGVERGPGLGDQVGEKRGFGIPARIGDRTKRSRACSGSGGAAGGSHEGDRGVAEERILVLLEEGVRRLQHRCEREGDVV